MYGLVIMFQDKSTMQKLNETLEELPKNCILYK